MKKIDRNAYQEKRYDKSHLMLLGMFVALISLALVIGGVWLFVKGVSVAGALQKTWRIVLAVIMVIFGLPIGYVSFMMIATAHSMINIKDGNVSDVGNSGMETVNVYKCKKCGTKLTGDEEHCTNCGAKINGLVKCECGAKNSVDAKHCAKCGKELK